MSTYHFLSSNSCFLQACLVWLLLIFPFALNCQTNFIEKAEKVGIDHFFLSGNMMGGGVAVFDYNNDGWEDIWINGGNRRDVLYQNQKDGTFIEVGTNAGLAITADYRTTGVVTGDINNDGYREVFITTREDRPNLLFLNNGDGTFTDISEAANIGKDQAWSTNAAFADVNLDGYQDIYVGNYVEEFGYIADRELGILSGYDHQCQPNFLYLNNQDGTFTEMGAVLFADDQGCALASAFTDFDSDGDSDLMVVNDYGEWVLPNSLLVNQLMENQAIGFNSMDTNATINVGIYAMGVAIGDYDQDNDLDYYITNIGRNALLQNQGEGNFVDSTKIVGIEDTYADSDFTVGWGTSFLDVDNDTDLDLLVANGFISTLSFNRTSLHNEDKLFINQGFDIEKNTVVFSDETKFCGLGDPSTARGLAKGDFDNDGDVDLVIVRVSGTSDPLYVKKVLYYENQLSNDNNWLKIAVKRQHGQDVMGTQIRIVLNDASWISEINGGSSHASQHSSILHFGLGSIEVVDSLIIAYPGGTKEIHTNILPNQLLTISENASLSTGIEDFKKETSFDLKIQPNPVKFQSVISFNNPSNKEHLLTVFNTLGNTIFKQKTSAGKVIFTPNLIPAGFYFLQIKDNNNRTDVVKFQMF